VSGKGIAAAMALTLVRATFRSLVYEGLSPGALVTQMSSRLYREWLGEPYLTCIVVRLDTGGGLLTYTNAGHPAGRLIRNQATTLLNLGGPPAGLFPEAMFQQSTVDLQPGDTCVLVTDGITEALDDDREQLSRAIAAVTGGPDGAAASECAAVVALAAQGHGPSGVDAWEDDRTVVVATLLDSGAAVKCEPHHRQGVAE
jgi:sigma-B regulation protein RsbU (phosphoserine phosphatase)